MQAKNKTLEPFDYASDIDVTTPSIFREALTVDNIIEKSKSIDDNYDKYTREKPKMANYSASTKEYEGTDYNDDILDDQGYRRYRPKLVDAQKEDGQTMLIQQNSMYIIGMITTATLLITAIMLAR